MAKDRVVSVVDPQARHAHKTVSRKQDGFKTHLAIEPDTGWITGCELTKATGPQTADGTVGTDLLGRDDSITEPVEVLGDSAYGTGDALDKIEQTGHSPLVKPWPTRPAVEGGFDIDDFTVDENAATVTCPAGVTRPITPKRNVTFGAACRGCPFAAQCTTAKDGRRIGSSTSRLRSPPGPPPRHPAARGARRNPAGCSQQDPAGAAGWQNACMLPSRVLRRAYREMTRRLPATTAARVDLMRPSFRNSWGGPLNGQEQRRCIVRNIARSVDVESVLETGTYRGTSTEFFRAVFGVAVETVEANPRLHAYSGRRLGFDTAVTVKFGDSRTFLKDAAVRRGHETTFIYLDAHWEDDLPLREELEIIGPAWRRAIVMIDDFAVPGDSGWGYDDYGVGKALNKAYLPPLSGWSLRYPSVPSESETGLKRGCCVLLSPPLADLAIPGLDTGAPL